MKFIIDAQLPRSLAKYLRLKGHDVVHTIDLPNGNLTEDFEVIKISMQDQRIVISKDSDFYDYYVLHQEPWKLLNLTTGNIVNKDLFALFDRNYAQLLALLNQYKVVEMNNFYITVHF
ncbi:MAG: DUF5615 family PIN-like protein [Lewinellaceae bacterium]|nr:DUF5615 family PIN-like protein [Saprospiraceae bacterium]MCB9341564.1 DUF5615 family PIN-like protein [Lewinellaceae bacterium]